MEHHGIWPARYLAGYSLRPSAGFAPPSANTTDVPIRDRQDVTSGPRRAHCVIGDGPGPVYSHDTIASRPPGPQATQNNWPERVTTMVASGQVGRAVFAFLTEIIGLTRGEVEALRDAPGGRDVLPIAAATLPREAHALAAADLTGIARLVRQPVLLLVGTASPPWAGEITRELATALPAATVAELPGAGHEALDTAPDLLVAEVSRFLGNEASRS